MNILTAIIDYMYPRVCHVCGEPLTQGARYVCASCLSRMPRTLYHRQPDNAMEQRFMGLFPFRQASGHFFYSRGSDLAILMHDLKYHRFRGLARYLGEVVGGELLTTGFLSDIDMILSQAGAAWIQSECGDSEGREQGKRHSGGRQP